MKREELSNKTPKEDMMNDALSHYEEASAAIHHYRSDIPKAIRAYYCSPTAEKPMTAEIDIHKMINDYHIKLSESRDAIEYALTQIDFGKTIESLIANASLKPTVEVSDEDISKLLDSFNFEASEEREDAWDLLNAMRELIKERSKI